MWDVVCDCGWARICRVVPIISFIFWFLWMRKTIVGSTGFSGFGGMLIMVVVVEFPPCDKKSLWVLWQCCCWGFNWSWLVKGGTSYGPPVRMILVLLLFLDDPWFFLGMFKMDFLGETLSVNMEVAGWYIYVSTILVGKVLTSTLGLDIPWVIVPH